MEALDHGVKGLRGASLQLLDDLDFVAAPGKRLCHLGHEVTFLATSAAARGEFVLEASAPARESEISVTQFRHRCTLICSWPVAYYDKSSKRWRCVAWAQFHRQKAVTPG